MCKIKQRPVGCRWSSLGRVTILAGSIASGSSGFVIVYPNGIIPVVAIVSMVARAAFGNDNSMVMEKVIFSVDFVVF